MAETAKIVSMAALRRRFPAVLAAFALLTASPGGELRSFAQEQTQPQLNAEQINQLVAPIALYPDNLLGQILTASTYPLEVVVAARWSASNQNVTGQALEDAMQLQSWDPSVKALTAVPQVLQMMSEKLEWIQQLGNAYLTQPDDIAAAVQILRARADTNGNLKSTDKVKVRRVAAPPPPPQLIVLDPLPPEYIIIEPYEPDYLYVPVYDPWVVYGVWPYPAWRPFYWYPPGYVAVGIIGFGAPILVGAALWANYNWYSRKVDVNVVKFNTFNKAKLANIPANQTWKYNPARNVGQQKQFGNFNPSSKTGTGQQLLNTNIKPQKGITTFNNPNGAVGGKNLKTKSNLNIQKNVNIPKNTTIQKTTTFQKNTFQKNTTIQKNTTLQKNLGTKKNVTTFSNQNVGGSKNLNIQKNTSKGATFNRNLNVKPNTNFKQSQTFKPNVNVRQNVYQKKKK